MPSALFSSLVLATLLAGAGAAFAAPDDVATITRQSQEFSDASASGDAATLAKYLDDNVIFVDESGEVGTKEDLVPNAKPPAEGISNHLVVKIGRRDDGLTGAVNGGEAAPMSAEAADVFFTPGQPRVRRVFERAADGRITGFNSRHEGHDLRFKSGRLEHKVTRLPPGKVTTSTSRWH